MKLNRKCRIPYETRSKSKEFLLVLYVLEEYLQDLEVLSLKDLKFLKNWLEWTEMNRNNLNPKIGPNKLKQLLKSYNAAIQDFTQDYSDEILENWLPVSIHTIDSKKQSVIYLPFSWIVESFIQRQIEQFRLSKQTNGYLISKEVGI